MIVLGGFCFIIVLGFFISFLCHEYQQRKMKKFRAKVIKKLKNLIMKEKPKNKDKYSQGIIKDLGASATGTNATANSNSNKLDIRGAI